MVKRIRIDVKPPFNFDLTLKATPPSHPFVYSNGVLKRAVKLSSGKLLPIEIRSIGTVDHPSLDVIALKDVNSRERGEIIDKLTWFFSLDDDLSKVYRLMEEDEALHPLIERFYGVKPWTVLTPFEGLVNAIIFQQVSIWAAFAMIKALVERLGSKVEVHGETFYDFPSVKTLAVADVGELRMCKLSRNKASYIKEIATKIANEKLDLHALKVASMEKALEILKKLKGIGTWTAEIFLATGLKRWEAIPADDLGVRRAISKFYFGGRKVTSQEVRNIAEKWGRYKWPIVYYLLVASERLERV
jgi:DNA-3-methyladenine glycosylase II